MALTIKQKYFMMKLGRKGIKIFRNGFERDYLCQIR